MQNFLTVRTLRNSLLLYQRADDEFCCCCCRRAFFASLIRMKWACTVLRSKWLQPRFKSQLGRCPTTRVFREFTSLTIVHTFAHYWAVPIVRHEKATHQKNGKIPGLCTWCGMLGVHRSWGASKERSTSCFLKMMICFSLCACVEGGMCSWGQVSIEAEQGVRSPGGTGSCEGLPVSQSLQSPNSYLFILWVFCLHAYYMCATPEEAKSG